MNQTNKIQHRDIATEEYRFNEEDHVHEILDNGVWKPLMGISSVTKNITEFSIPAYYGSRRALMELGFDPKVDRAAQGETERQNKEAESSLARLKAMTVSDWKKLLLNAYKAHATYSKSRADKGTNSHDVIDQWIKKCIAENDGNPMPYDIPVVKKFMSLTSHLNPRFIASEKHGYNRELWIGGITDVIVETNIGLGIWDNKDRAAIYGKDLLQFGGYTLLFPDKKFTHVLGIPLEGNETRIFYDVEQLQKAFINQIGVYKFMQSVEPKQK